MRAYVTNRIIVCANEGNGAVLNADVVLSGAPLEFSTLTSISVPVDADDSAEAINAAVVAAVDVAVQAMSLEAPESIVAPAFEALR